MKCDFISCDGEAIHVQAKHDLGDCDYHECAPHLIAQAERHEAIAARIRRMIAAAPVVAEEPVTT